MGPHISAGNLRLINGTSMQSHTFCSHDWSFLENTCNFSNSSPHSTVSSSKRSLPHIRTLKAGRHTFPFTFTLTGNFPSTLKTHPLNLNMSAFPTTVRASITYNLRAVASRPGLSLGQGPLHNVHIMPMVHNLTCAVPVHVLRSLSPVALEYQQSVEVENSWPEKLMYAIMLPHGAWAAGDTLIAVLKLSPLAKGVWVENVVTTLWETTELHAQHHHRKNALHQSDKYKMAHSETRIVRCIKHEIVDGKAVRVSLLGERTRSNIRAGSRSGSTTDHSSSPTSTSGATGVEDDRFTEFENHDIVTYITFPIPHLATGPYSSTQTTPTTASPPISLSRSPSPPLSYPSGSPATPPSFSPSSTATVNPTHNLPPLVVSHRIRWSFHIHNGDGHTSELRCSLPIHILDGKILFEAREASVLTRRMALAAEGLWRGEEDEGLGLSGGDSGGGEFNEFAGDIYVERHLPTYTAHVRDRVANMYYPEMATVRVPWVDMVAAGEGTTADSPNSDRVEGGLSQNRLRSASGRIAGHQPNQHHPQAPSALTNSSPLDWVNSDLMSLSSSESDGQDSMNQNGTHSTYSPQIRSEVPSSFERRERISDVRSSLPTSSDGPGGGHPVRALSNFVKATIRPFTSHHHGNGLFGLSKSSSPLDDNPDVPSPGPSRYRSLTRRVSSPPTLPSSQPFHCASSTLNRSLSEVPNYFVASQGFMGGVPPLSSLVGLPSYEEAANAKVGPRPRDEEPNDPGPSSIPLPSSRQEVVVTDSATREIIDDINLRGRFGRLLSVSAQPRSERRNSTSGNSSASEEGIQLRTKIRDQC